MSNYLILFCLLFTICSGLGEEKTPKLPSWIVENPGFQKPTIKDSIKTGNGSVGVKEKGEYGWLIHLNEKEGHGIEILVENLTVNPDFNEFLLISAWPITDEFKKIKLFTGNFTKPLKKLRIPNTKSFLVLYSTYNSTASEFNLKYRRYGISFEVAQPPTDSPIKKKETAYEVQLKGKPPEKYFEPNFLKKFKEALRKTARRYCKTNQIYFNESIPIDDMVLIHRVSYCPFEWPDRDVCASVQHSIFVSGEVWEDVILNYQLVADHLRIMWSVECFEELEELGIKIFRLPPTNNTIFYWTIIIALMIFSSFMATCIFWRAHDVSKLSPRTNSRTSEVIQKVKKPKLRLAKHQRVPSFMRSNPTETQIDNFKDPVMRTTNGDSLLKQQNFDDFIKPGDSSGLPIRNYFGSILFSGNRAFEEDDEDENSIELRQK